MMVQIRCSGTTAEGRACTQKLNHDPGQPWYCHLHRAQAGIGKSPIEKTMVGAEWPRYLPEKES